MEGWQRAFVLHSRPRSETSLVLDVFTEESGRVRLVAKGARSKRSNLKGALQPFTPLLLRFGGRGEVKTLRSAEAVSLALPLAESRCTAACILTSLSRAYSNTKPAFLHSFRLPELYSGAGWRDGFARTCIASL